MTHDTARDRRRGRALSLFRLAFACMIATASGCSSAGPRLTEIRVTEDVILESPPRLGVNLGRSTYYNDQQLVANPLAYGAFNKGRQMLQIRSDASAGANTVTDEYFAEGDPDRTYAVSFKDGEYYVATGARAGEKGRIVDHPPGSGTFTLEHDGPPFSEHDVIWLRGPVTSHASPQAPGHEPALGIGDWRAFAGDGVELDFVDCEGIPGNQCLRVQFPATGERLAGGAKHYIKATPGTNYRIRVRARADLPDVSLGIRFENLGMEHGDPGHLVNMRADGGTTLGPEWREYVFEGRTALDDAVAERFSAITVGLAVTTSEEHGGAAYIDAIHFEDEKLDSPSGFARQVVDALKEARTGVLRFYGIQGMGALVDTLTARNAVEGPWNFLGYASGARFNGVGAVMDQWFQLAIEVGADPWLTIGGANNPDDYYRLISYLAAPADFDADSARRAAHGHPEPWTASVDKIYIEIGNEWWNAIFRPFYIWDAAIYGELCRNVIARIREHPHFDPGKFEIIAGGWAINAHHWNTRLDASSEGHDRISLAPYVVHELDAYASPEMRYGTLFAEVSHYPTGGGRTTREGLAQNAKGTGLAVYELNTHITGGAAPASAASEIVTSLAAGVAVLDQAMSLMSQLEAQPINYFTLLQRAFGHGENRRTGLWGSLVRTPSGNLRARPIWHGLRLANQYLIEGDMVAAEFLRGSTWNFPGNGNVPEVRGARHIHAYAFMTQSPEGARQCNVLLINRHLHEALPVRLHLPFTPRNPVTRATLAGASPGLNNEEAENVAIETGSEDGVGASSRFLVPPHGAVVYQFVEAGG